MSPKVKTKCVLTNQQHPEPGVQVFPLSWVLMEVSDIVTFGTAIPQLSSARQAVLVWVNLKLPSE